MSPILRRLLPESRIFVAGHTGLVGSAMLRHLDVHGFQNLIVVTSAEVDLRDASATREFFARALPDVVINAAAMVGGIAANAVRPADFLSANLSIQLNMLESAVGSGVQRFLFLGSSCIYPKLAELPIREDAILAGPLEETNEGFAMAKLAGVKHVAAIRRQYGLPYICAMPTSLYGPGDNFSPEGSHVLPAMIRRFHEAAQAGVEQVTCWGTGRPLREFLYVDDFAQACHTLLDSYDDDRPINVGTGEELSIAELAILVADIVGYRGDIRWDANRPDGTYRKVLDVHRIKDLGWSAKTSLADGIRSTYEWFVRNQGDYRR
jgi:GDP-L-fucose synthase